MSDSKRLRVLITNIVMNGRSGSEIVTRDLATGLLQDGHTPIIYSPELGEIARELKSMGIPVLRSIDQICQAPDIIHGHHVVQTGVAAARFPNIPAIFVCHDFVAWHDAPPRLPNIFRYVAVGDATSDRLMIEGGIAPSAVRTIENGVNIERFKPGKPPPDRPRNALIMVKGLRQIEPIVEACKARGIKFDLAGPAVGKTLHKPESIVPSYDLIFASGLTAIESMACLRPVIVCDSRGLAGFVDTPRYQRWRRQNFGLRTLESPLTKQNVLAELDRYSPTEAIAVGSRVRSEASLERWIHRYVELYRECIREFNPARELSQSEAAALALHIQTWSGGGFSEHARERGLLHQEIATLQTGLLPLRFGERVLSTDISRIALRGFYSREDWAVWSARPWCTAIFRCVACDFPLAIQIEYVPYLSPAQPNREIACLINGEHSGSWTDQSDIGKCRTRLINLPESPDQLEVVFLLFRSSGLVSPAAENISADARPLGMALVALTLVRAEAKPGLATV